MSTTEPGIQTTEQPNRRRWKPWVALGLVLVMAYGFWPAAGEGQTIRRSRKLRVGMTKAQVHAIMGDPTETWILPRLRHWELSNREHEGFATPLEIWLKDLRLELEFQLAALRSTQDPIWITLEELPVGVLYENGRVSQITRKRKAKRR